MHAGFWMEGERGMEGGGQMSGQRRRATRYIAAFSDGLVLLPHLRRHGDAQAAGTDYERRIATQRLRRSGPTDHSQDRVKLNF